MPHSGLVKDRSDGVYILYILGYCETSYLYFSLSENGWECRNHARVITPKLVQQSSEIAPNIPKAWVEYISGDNTRVLKNTYPTGRTLETLQGEPRKKRCHTHGVEVQAQYCPIQYLRAVYSACSDPCTSAFTMTGSSKISLPTSASPDRIACTLDFNPPCSSPASEKKSKYSCDHEEINESGIKTTFFPPSKIKQAYQKQQLDKKKKV